MVRKSRVPPDAGVDIFGKILPMLVGAGFGRGPVDVNCVGARDHHLRSFAFAGVHVDGSLLRWSARRWRALIENVDYIVVRLVELRLGEVREQVLVAAVSVDDDYLLASITRHLVGGFLQQRKLQIAAVSHGSGLVAGLSDL